MFMGTPCITHGIHYPHTYVVISKVDYFRGATGSKNEIKSNYNIYIQGCLIKVVKLRYFFSIAPYGEEEKK